MRHSIEAHLPAIRALCAAHGVGRLELFGSAARGNVDPSRSDVDLFVEFRDLGWQGSFKRYMGLKLGLEDLLGHPVDLVESSAVENPHFKRVAEQRKELLYAA